MPYAPAHPAVVLPLQGVGLPLSALVAGSVSPDVPVYLPVGVSYATTHSGPGVVVSAAFGLVLLWLWFGLVRDAVVDLAAGLRDRLPARSRLTRRAWLLAPIALLVGAATHVLWDSTTHDWGFVVRDAGFLREEYGPLPLYGWLQHTSTVVGSAVVAAYGMVVLGRRPVRPRPPSVRRPAVWWAPIPVAALLVGVALRDPNAGAGAALVALLGVAGVWRVVRQPQPS